jgi:hypothetical protein
MERKFKRVLTPYDSNKLIKLITENPSLPLVFLAGEDANNDYGRSMYCSRMTCEITEILDCDYMRYDLYIFDDRDDLEEYVYDNTDTDEEAQKLLAELEPYWTKAIVVCVDN